MPEIDSWVDFDGLIVLQRALLWWKIRRKPFLCFLTVPTSELMVAMTRNNQNFWQPHLNPLSVFSLDIDLENQWLVAFSRDIFIIDSQKRKILVVPVELSTPDLFYHKNVIVLFLFIFLVYYNIPFHLNYIVKKNDDKTSIALLRFVIALKTLFFKKILFFFSRFFFVILDRFKV